MIKGYVKIFTLGCNFMLLFVGCRALVPCVLLCHNDTINSHMDILIYNIIPSHMSINSMDPGILLSARSDISYNIL